mgnify:CR=1 FL=1
MKKVLIEEMSWVEFRSAMTDNDLIIFPVGSIEEHGPHNPLGTDYLIAKKAAYDIGTKVNAPVAPVMPIGNASNLMGFPGTVTLDPELLRNVLLQVCEGFIKQGAKRFLFINGHGGNTSTIKIVSNDLYEKYKVFSTQTEWWIILKQMSEFPCNDHGGKHETSMMMVVDDSLIDMGKANTVKRKNLTEKLIYEGGLTLNGVSLPSTFPLDKVTPVGNYGARAEEASRELGEKMYETYINYCCKLAEEIRKIPMV